MGRMHALPLQHRSPVKMLPAITSHSASPVATCPHLGFSRCIRNNISLPFLSAACSAKRQAASFSGGRIHALDAAMPFDFEHRARAEAAAAGKLLVGIVGFGTFGQFLARRMVQAGHSVIATSRSPYQEVAAAMGVGYFQDVDDFCEEHPDVVILSTSILSLEQVFKALPVQRLRRNTLFMDVLSVKEFPKRLLLSQLPEQVDILCTHPMFGPDSGRGSWDGLNFMFERVRVGDGDDRAARLHSLLGFFEGQGCKMVEMSCEEHDRMAASTQFITHTLGRTLGAMGLSETPIDTKGFQSLLTLVDNTANDSFELYYGLFMYNQTATLELERLEHAFDSVKKQLFDRLHDKLRAQLFSDGGPPGGGEGGGEAAAAAAAAAAPPAAPVYERGRRSRDEISAG